MKARAPNARLHVEPYLARLPASCEAVEPGKENPEWTIKVKLGKEKCDVGQLREPLHVKFANWKRTPDEIAVFTKNYGLLMGNYLEDREGKFRVAFWQGEQERFRELWTVGHKGPQELFRRVVNLPGTLSVEDFDALLGSVRLDFGRNGLVMSVAPTEMWAYLVLCLLTEKPGSLRKCLNLACPAPYFVARRKDQEFCSSHCARLVTNRRWWRNKGKSWRRKRKKSGKKKQKARR